MVKRGDFNLSFGMIFSILIIVAILAIAVYVIVNFLSTSKCAQVGIFFDDLKEHIDKAWKSTIHGELFIGTLPSDIEYVCFGSIDERATGESEKIRNKIYRDFMNDRDKNVVLYPPQRACDFSMASFKLNHVLINGFFCLPVQKGRIQIKTEKDQYSALVNVSPP